MKNRRMLQLGLVTVVLGMSLVGCGTDESDNKAEKTEATEQVTVTEKNTTGEDAADISADDTEDIADTYDESTEFTLPVYDDFTLEQGLSEKYADMDNRSFVYNGTKLILGESTLKDLIDAGIPFDESDLNNSGNNVNVNYETERYQASINDYVRYSHLYVPQPGYDASMNAEISEYMIDGAKKVHFSFPTTLTKDELLENSSENAEEDGKNVKYMIESEVYMGDSGYEFEFNDVTGQLKEVRISWLP